MSSILVLVTSAPLVLTLLCVVAPRRFNEIATVVVSVAMAVLAIALVPAATSGTVTAGFLRADALSVVFLIATAVLYALTAVYSIGYLKVSVGPDGADGDARRVPDRYRRRFYVGLNAFAWSMLCAPLVNGLAMLWIAIEITTVVSALLVALDNTDGAAEAAWKYVLIASSGLGIALLSTIVLYYAGSQVLGSSYDLAFDPLLKVARELPATPVQLAFGLAVVGFGTKVGLFPVHTWLPDAHAEAPTPVSVLLSGALLATSFYAILRFFQIAVAALGPTFPQTVLLIFGVLSLLLAALSLFDQHHVKRMLAYSSIEHMGILAIGVSFGAPLAFVGVLLHVIAHALAKGGAFMGAGVLVHTFGTKDIGRIRGALTTLPWSGPMFLLCVFALSAFPPFGIFRSEFTIVAGGIAASHGVAAASLVALVTFAFAGLAIATTRMLVTPAEVTDVPVPRGEPSTWMVVPVVLALAGLVVLGVHLPNELVALLNAGAAELQGVGR